MCRIERKQSPIGVGSDYEYRLSCEAGKVASNRGEFGACAGLEFPPPSKLMVAHRSLGDRKFKDANCISHGERDFVPFDSNW
jgi:hypothetical protein